MGLLELSPGQVCLQGAQSVLVMFGSASLALLACIVLGCPRACCQCRPVSHVLTVAGLAGHSTAQWS